MKYLTFIAALLFTTATFASEGYDEFQSKEDLVEARYLIADEYADEIGVMVITTLKCPLERYDDGTYRVGAWSYTATVDADGNHDPNFLMCGDIVNITNDDNGVPHVPFIAIPTGNLIVIPLGVFRKI